MNCEVRGVSKNIRYRILTIEGEDYILDTGRSFWKIVFPFFFWILPNPVFKVNDRNIVEKLKSPEVKQTKTEHSSIFGGGIGVFLATILKPLADYLALPDTPLINAVILSILVIFVSILYVYLNNVFKKKLHHVVNLRELPADKLWIWPESIKHFFQGLFSYLVLLALTLALFYLSIAYSDVITLFFTMIVLFFLLFTNLFMTRVGHANVKFTSRKKTAV